MSDRAQKYEAFLDDLAPLVDAEPEALARHADFLADDDEARDIRHEAAEVAQDVAQAGADFIPAADLEARLLAALDARDAGAAADEAPAEHEGRTTNPGFAVPGEATNMDAPSPGASSSNATSSEPPSSEPPSEAEAPAAIEATAVSRPVSPTEKMASYPGASPSGPRAAQEAARTDDEAASRPGAGRGPASPPARGKLLAFAGAGVLALAAAAALGLFAWTPDEEEVAVPSRDVATEGIDGTLAHVDRASDDGRSGVSIRRAGAGSFVALSGEDAAIPAGSIVRTDERTRAQIALADGSVLVLNHATELELVLDRPRSFRLADGELVADVAHLEGAPNVAFSTPTGLVTVLGTKFVLTATEEVTSVRVSRGVVSVATTAGEAAEVRAGEEGLLRRGGAPRVTAVSDLAGAMAWSELSAVVGDADADDVDTIAGIGSLRARRPGQRGDRERPLNLASHQVRVRIVGNVARTEIEEVFRNDSDVVLEGIYKFPLPADAQIARLALDVDGRMEEGAFVERDRASRIWAGVIRNATPTSQRQVNEEFIWVPGPWRDPAILEWQRGGQFELRVFPIPAHGERRVILAYTQTVSPQGARRRYVYPMAHSADDSTRVGQFDLDVRVAGAEHVVASGYRVTSAAEQDATRLSFSEAGFTPKGDLVIDYELPGGERDLRYWTYRGDAALAPPADARDRDREVLDLQRQLASDPRPYVAFALRPELPRATERRRRDYVLVVDSSQSMVGERFHRAATLSTHLVREMDRRDRFTVLACDYECRAMPGGLQAPGAHASQQAEAWLEEIEPAGASDIAGVLREAVATASAERRDDRELHVMYVGDGASSVGYRRAASLSAEVRALASAERVAISAVGIGADADTMVLRAIARSAGGHYVPYVPGQRISVAALSVLETSYGASLESPQVELPDGISEVAPGALPTIRAGQEVLLVGRMDRDRVQGSVVLRGSVAGRPFEQRYDVDLVPTESEGNRFVPQLWAAGRIEELQLSGRGEERARIIATSKAFGVLSRHTSLLVLESEAMFRAFRIDRREATAQWTGEEDVVAGDAQAQGPQLESSGGLGTIGGGLGLSGTGRGGGGYGEGAGGLRTRGRASRPSSPARAARAASEAEINEPWGGAPAGAAPRLDDRDEAAEEAPARRAPPPTDALWADMPDPRVAAQQPAPAATPMPLTLPTPRRRPGQWMRRISVRVGAVTPGAEPTSAERRLADEAEAALRGSPDSRDRHRDAVQRLARLGELDRALEVADAWIARDRLDPEALTAKADLLGRLGHRDEALRLLTGTVDLSPDSESLHRRLASAFERAGRPERACGHLIALAEIDESDPAALGNAMRCERTLGREDAAVRLMTSVREASVRTRGERLAGEDDGARRFRGDFTIEAEWSGADEIDLSIVTPQGTRLSWMGGRTTVVGEDVSSSGREKLGLRWTGVGTYVIEVNRTDPEDTREIRGELRVRVLGERRTIPFRLRDAREAVARVRVSRETRMVSPAPR